MQNKLEKFSSFGAIVAAAACPICLPKLALLGALFGLGALAAYETVFFFAAQILVVLAVVGHTISYSIHRNWKLFSLTLVSALMLFISLYAFVSEILSYAAFAGLIVSTIWLMEENRRYQSCAATPE